MLHDLHPLLLKVRRLELNETHRVDLAYAVEKGDIMLANFLLWLILLFFCWPLALLAIVLYPIVWLFLLPFRLLGITVDAVFHLLRAIIRLPFKVLGGSRAT